ncbi:hypothetical protein E2C01_024342 [Portunus trituberculatus]|uniref:Uncharacterized protein n=1 Tax=Portunus trituberculatus TaxID=210409 RepID=A0A5B7EEF7_PORTR|nr:hypothetical protein [Portunus trituberculatus]
MIRISHRAMMRTFVNAGRCLVVSEYDVAWCVVVRVVAVCRDLGGGVCCGAVVCCSPPTLCMRCPQLTTAVLGAYQGSDSAMCEAVSLDLSPITEDFQKMYSDWQQHLGSLQTNSLVCQYTVRLGSVSLFFHRGDQMRRWVCEGQKINGHNFHYLNPDMSF